MLRWRIYTYTGHRRTAAWVGCADISLWLLQFTLQDPFVVSRQALEAWVSEHCINTSLQHAFSTAQFHNVVDDALLTEISTSDIICEHGALDPTMSRDMKLLTPVCGVNSIHFIQDELISPSSIHWIRSLRRPIAHLTPFPKRLTSVGIASLRFSKVILFSFVFPFFDNAWNLEKLYEIEHPKHTALFDELSVIDEDETGYWISKKWCRGSLFYSSTQLLQLTPKKTGN